MDKNFEILEHTADLKMKVWGNTLPELFKNAMEGMMKIIKRQKFYPADARRGKKIKIKVESGDAAALLIDFLNEVLYQAQVNKEVYVAVNFSKFNSPSTDSGRAGLEAELFGYPIAKFDEDIKAATYHEAEIKKGAQGGFETTVLFDI